MPYFSSEFHLGWLEWISIRNNNFDPKNAAFIASTNRALDRSLEKLRVTFSNWIGCDSCNTLVTVRTVEKPLTTYFLLLALRKFFNDATSIGHLKIDRAPKKK